MTDLEITKLCAEAIGLTQFSDGSVDCRAIGGVFGDNFAPLHDDAQAMALVKKFRIKCNFHYDAGEWIAEDPYCGNLVRKAEAWNENLNRAICECVAKMQNATTSKGEVPK